MRKKFICSLLVTLFSLSGAVRAQQFHYGVQLGGNLTTFKGFEQGGLGYEAGVFAQYQWAGKEGWFVESGLSLVKTQGERRGISVSNLAGKSLSHTTTFYPVALHMPLLAGYRVPITQGLSLSVAGGLYGGVGLFGKGTYTVSSLAMYGDNSSTSALYRHEELNNVYKEAGLRRLSWGLNFRVGAHFAEHWRVSIDHRWAMNTCIKGGVPQDASAGYGKSNTWAVSVGYTF